MKSLNFYRIRFMLVVFAAVIVLGDSVRADFTFGEPMKVGPSVNSSFTDATPCISADGLNLYFTSTRPGGWGSLDLWVAKRNSIDQSWSDPENLGKPVNTSAAEGFPSISSDRLSLYYASDRPGGSGGGDIWQATRTSIEANWSEPINLGPNVNSPSEELSCCISPNGTELFISSNRPGGMGGYDLYVARRATTDQPWSDPVNLGPPVNGSASDGGVSISLSNNILMLFIHSDRVGGFGGHDLYSTSLRTVDDVWSEPVNLGSIINTDAMELRPSLAKDARVLYFGGFYMDLGSDIWQAPIIPIVDFNSDGIVEIGDLLFLIQFWGQDDSTTDIGPAPWGDGIVDEADLEILMSYWGLEVEDPTLIAHWKLDETEGDIAFDSVGENNCTLYGELLWQPDGGMIKGALQLNGINDYMSTPFVLDPASGKFRVFAWIKGGAPGQTIISQANGANWLSADPSEGKLTTELKGSDRNVQTLVSQTHITDGNWHRIGFLWDGSYRTLYFDDIEVARDINVQSGLAGSDGGLHIGAGKNLEPGAFFSGLIDDIRVYNRAVTP
jgi:hypothetical protein